REHLGALVEADHRGAFLPDQLCCDQPRSGCDIEDAVAGSGFDTRDEEAAPAGVLPQREQARVAVVGRPERSEKLARAARPGWNDVGQRATPMLVRGG